MKKFAKTSYTLQSLLYQAAQLRMFGINKQIKAMTETYVK